MTSDQDQELAELQRRKALLIRKISRISAQYRDLKKQRIEVQTEVSDINRQIVGMNGGLTVSDHAKLRYIERVLGIDLTEVEHNINTKALRDMVQTCGDGKYPLTGQSGHKVVVVDNQVRTVT